MTSPERLVPATLFTATRHSFALAAEEAEAYRLCARPLTSLQARCLVRAANAAALDLDRILTLRRTPR
jgi:hypothetical protein